MGNGRYLKELLDKRNMSIRQLAKESNIAPTTLYSMINRNSVIRYDFAVKIAGILGVPVSEICSEVPDINMENEAQLFSNKMLEIGKQCSNDELKEFEELMECFYIINNDARKEILDYIKLKSAIHSVPERVLIVENF